MTLDPICEGYTQYGHMDDNTRSMVWFVECFDDTSERCWSMSYLVIPAWNVAD